jgi:hypothetical protein
VAGGLASTREGGRAVIDVLMIAVMLLLLAATLWLVPGLTRLMGR